MAKYKCKDPKCPNKKSLNQPGYCPECGGKLVKKSSNALVYGILGVGVIFILLIAIGAYTVMTTPINYTSTNQDQKQTPVKNEKTNPVFENQYFKFEYSNNYQLIEKTNSDDSSSEIMDIWVNKGSKELVGEITYGESNQADTNRIKEQYSKITVAGKEAYEYSDFGSIGCFIILDENKEGFSKTMIIDFDPEDSAVYNQIKNSLVIKKIP